MVDLDLDEWMVEKVVLISRGITSLAERQLAEDNVGWIALVMI